jgi:hypothetical protein
VTARKSAAEEWRAVRAVNRDNIIDSLNHKAIEAEDVAKGEAIHGPWRRHGAACRVAIAVLEAAAQPRRRVVGWCVREGDVRGAGRYLGGSFSRDPTWWHYRCDANMYDSAKAAREARDRHKVGGRVVAIVERAPAQEGGGR